MFVPFIDQEFLDEIKGIAEGAKAAGAGIVGTETTIGGFSQYRPNEAPEFFRVRRAMQYAVSLDQFADLMKKQNSGGYANGWLLGDIRTGEIMRFELGLKFTGIDRTRDGYYIGFNAPYDPRIRNLECSGMVWGDIRTPEGARQVRLAQLMDGRCLEQAITKKLVCLK